MDRSITSRIYAVSVICFLILLLVKHGCLLAQSDLEENSITNQLWTDINFSYQLKERSSVLGDIGFRSVSPHEWNRYVIRSAFGHKLPNRILKNLNLKKELIGGIGFFYTSNFGAPNRFEIRPFQGFRLDWPDRTKIRIRHYVKVEERFELTTDEWKNTFGVRLRYLAELTIRLQGDLIKFNKGIYLPVSAELFWNLIGTNQFNDHVRIGSGIGYSFSDRWSAELFTSYHYTRNTVEEDFTTNDIVYRIRAFYRIK